jgi:hypothetical protein
VYVSNSLEETEGKCKVVLMNRLHFMEETAHKKSLRYPFMGRLGEPLFRCGCEQKKSLLLPRMPNP